MSQPNEIILPTPYPAQIPVIRTCLDTTTKYIIVSGGRQIGKSTICAITAIYWAQQEANQHIMCVSKTDSQASQLQERIIGILNPVFDIMIKRNKIQAGSAEILFNNGSKILFRSSGSIDGLRGYSNTHLILDECAFFSEDIFKKILAPSMSVRGKNGKILFSSTPCGKNYFFNLFLKGQENLQSLYRSFKITFNDNPYADHKLIEEERLSSHPDIFNQEYLGEFIDSSSVFHNVDELATLKSIQGPIEGHTYYGGVDIGMLNDFTVISIVNQLGQMVYYDRFTGVESPELIQRLLNTIRKFKPVNTLIETNNQGLPIYQQLIRLQSGLNPFSTNATTKPELIQHLISAFSSKSIQILDDEQVKLELQAYTFNQSKTGHIKFNASSGFHDDICISLALAWRAYRGYNNPNKYQIITNQNAPKQAFDDWIEKLNNDITQHKGGGGYKFM